MPISAEHEAQQDAQEVHRYAVWGIIPNNAKSRVLKVMKGLREEFGGPEIKPQICIVGSSLMTEEEAIDSFRGLVTRSSNVEHLETSKFYFQCVSLVMEIIEDTRWFAGSMRCPFPAMPHLSLLYATLNDEDEQRAKEKLVAIDETIPQLGFLLSRVALYRVNFRDRTQKSCVKVCEGNLKVN